MWEAQRISKSDSDSKKAPASRQGNVKVSELPGHGIHHRGRRHHDKGNSSAEYVSFSVAHGIEPLNVGIRRPHQTAASSDHPVRQLRKTCLQQPGNQPIQLRPSVQLGGCQDF